MEKRYRSIEQIKERYERELPVLGQTYHIKVKDPELDPRLGKDHDGYCDWTTKEIAMSDMIQDAKHPDAVADFDRYRETVLRHEIIHAFIEESGNTDADWNAENMVNWLACMWPHLHEAMSAAYCDGEDRNIDIDPEEKIPLALPPIRKEARPDQVVETTWIGPPIGSSVRSD